MKKTMLVLSLVCAFFALANDAAAQKKKMIVNDYFLDIPQEYIKIDRVQRAKWIEDGDAANGYLKFNVPFSEDEDLGGAEVWGEVKLFPAKSGKMFVGMIVNRCLESVCAGQLLMLEHSAGKWTNVSETLVPSIDNDEIAQILKSAPAYERPVVKDEEIPLALGFQRAENMIQYFAACASPGCDGAVVPKIFKWNGAKFEAFEYDESP